MSPTLDMYIFKLFEISVGVKLGKMARQLFRKFSHHGKNFAIMMVA